MWEKKTREIARAAAFTTAVAVVITLVWLAFDWTRWLFPVAIIVLSALWWWLLLSLREALSDALTTSHELELQLRNELRQRQELELQLREAAQRERKAPRYEREPLSGEVLLEAARARQTELQLRNELEYTKAQLNEVLLRLQESERQRREWRFSEERREAAQRKPLSVEGLEDAGEFTRMFRSPTPPVPLDAVHFTITAPLAVMPKTTIDLTFWAHLDKQREEVMRRAMRIVGARDKDSLLLRSEGPFELPRGARLTVRISIPGFNVAPTHKPLFWLGEIASASFLISVPADAQPGPHAAHASIRLDGMQIGRISFLLTVGPTVQPLGAVPIPDTKIHKTAFASYASQDRDHVIARVQGMEAAAKHLKVFVDVVDLRSGDLWEHKLWDVIPQSDIFYLFWCRHAQASPWVEKEWRCAVTKRGLDFIDPVPLESPDHAPPPTELASKHFNDPLLAFIKGTHA